MKMLVWLVDAFSHGQFTGNPAGVCVLDAEPDPGWMQNVAMEMNQAETAFSWPKGDGFGLRWFTPTVEVDLCGHATLATVHVMAETELVSDGQEVKFHTASGPLLCRIDQGQIWMDFPEKPVKPLPVPASLVEMFGGRAVWFGTNNMDWFVELVSEEDVVGFVPDHGKIAALGFRGMVVTAKAETVKADFVSRFFAPGSWVPEDHVTGSAHCALGPYWAERLGRAELTGYQASRRGGFVKVDVRDDRVILGGRARTVLTGSLQT